MGKDAIGGYFGFEVVNTNSVYHDRAIPLNTGRNALELIIKLRGYQKGFIPYYTCEAILSAFERLGVEYEFYRIDRYFKPLLDYNKVSHGEFLLYTNYFGLTEQVITELSTLSVKLIIDNSQAFYSRPSNGIDAFYSARKFFGLPDGGFAYINALECPDLPVDDSTGRLNHLLNRLKYGAEAGYQAYLANEALLARLPVMRMSDLTHALASGLDYKTIANKRRNNYELMEYCLRGYNGISVPFTQCCVPMAYPFYFKCSGLREYLAASRIFIPKYWSNVLEWCPLESCIEVDFTEHLLPLPIDQRMSEKDVVLVANAVKRYLEENEN